MAATQRPIADRVSRTQLDDEAADRLLYALEYLQDIRFQLAMSQVDPLAWPDQREEIASDLDLAIEGLTALFALEPPTTPRWLGNPEDDESPETLAELAAERRTYRRVLTEFRRGASGRELAWAIAEEDLATDATEGIGS